MNTIYKDVDIGKKNIGLGFVLFLVLGVLVGIPLTVDLFGGSLLEPTQYQAWKVVHAYGVFLAFVNFFFGYCVDRLSLSRQQKEIASWAFVIAGLAGGAGRPVLLLLSSLGGAANYAVMFIETLGFVIGTFVFVRGQVKERTAGRLEQPVRVSKAV